MKSPHIHFTFTLFCGRHPGSIRYELAVSLVRPRMKESSEFHQFYRLMRDQLREVKTDFRGHGSAVAFTFFHFHHPRPYLTLSNRIPLNHKMQWVWQKTLLPDAVKTNQSSEILKYPI